MLTKPDPANVLQLLVEARERIADPKHWTRGFAACDGVGVSVPARSTSAVCWCAIGAVKSCDRAPGSGTCNAAIMCLDAAAVVFGYTPAGDSDHDDRPIVRLNDDTDHATVMRAFDIAIDGSRAAVAP